MDKTRRQAAQPRLLITLTGTMGDGHYFPVKIYSGRPRFTYSDKEKAVISAKRKATRERNAKAAARADKKRSRES